MISIRKVDRNNRKVEWWAYPKSSARPIPSEVPDQYASDFNEAALILADSPKGSAAISRRLLQYILRDVAKVKRGNLSDEIEQFINSPASPAHLKESVDAVRNIGNFAAHPSKNTATGEIVEVEPGEAEWLLDVLESMFDFFFVQPAVLAKRRDALNKKLGSIGKPPMK